MLQFIRSKSSSLLIKVLFFALAIAFGFWGIGDIFRAKVPEVTVARVGDTTISETQFQLEYQRQLKQVSAALGSQFTGDIAKQMGLPQQVLDRMVGQALFRNFANALGLRAPDDVLRSTMERMTIFLDPSTGQFDRQRFDQFLSNAGMTEDGFIATLTNQIIEGQLADSIGTGAVAPKALVNAVYGYRAEKRIADTLQIIDATMTNIPAPDAATLEKYHQDHPDRYQAPEYRKFTVVRLRPETLAAGIKIGDDQIAQEYAAHPEQYMTPPKRQFLTFTVLDEAAAKKVVGDLAAGKDFAAVAKLEGGGDPTDTGLIEKAELVQGMGGVQKELADPAFTAANGAVVGPIQTTLGWEFAKVMKIEPGKPRPLAEVKDAIAKSLAQSQASDAVTSIANQLDDTLAGGATLEEAAKKLALPIESVDAVTNTGMDATGKPIGDLVGTPQLLPTAFSTDAGQVTPLGDDGTGGYFLLRVDQVTPATLRPYNEVKDKVLADWQDEARDKAAADQAAKIAARVNAGEDLASIAKLLNLPVKRSQPFTRDEGDPADDVPVSLASLLFSTKRGQATTGPNDSGASPGHIVAVVVAIQPANPNADEAGTKKLEDELSRSLADDLIAEFRKALEAETTVTIDLKAAEAHL